MGHTVNHQLIDSEAWTCSGCGGQMIGSRTPDDLCGPCIAARLGRSAAAADHDALAAILEALDIPYAASVGDEQIRAKILDARLMHTLIMLRGWLEDDRPGWQRQHSLDYLRERLAEHPAAGYRTDYAEVMADWAAGRKAAAEAGR